MNPGLPPHLAADPHSELAAALEHAIELQDELLKVHQRIRELNEQVIQHQQQGGGVDDEREALSRGNS